MGPIAQSVEQRTFNPWVDGSSPSGPTQKDAGIFEYSDLKQASLSSRTPRPFEFTKTITEEKKITWNKGITEAELT